MSDIALRSSHFAGTVSLGARLRTLADRWLARTSRPVAELPSLGEHLLIDIGIDPRDIPRPSMAEVDRLCLLERGWYASGPR